MGVPADSLIRNFEGDMLGKACCNIPADEYTAHCLLANLPRRTSAFSAVRDDKTCMLKPDEVGVLRRCGPLPHYFGHMFAGF